ncbi:MAG: hypothetical protein K5871_03940 [Lachnospiraceae bacterium]|nr:hypothetical protein [Lachnospiraceae bacterium]
MKNSILKGIAAIICAAVVALIVNPVYAQAAGKPAVSLTSDFYNIEGTAFVMLNNNGSLGQQVNNYTWYVYEKCTDRDTGNQIFTYSESRKGIKDPVYVDLGRFDQNRVSVMTIMADCPELNYSYTVSFTLKDGKKVGASFQLVTSASNILCNGQKGELLDGYRENMGTLARNSINAFMPAGYMIGCEGVICFNYKLDYSNKSGIACFSIPEGVYASNRTYKLLALSEGGMVTVYDDLDANPGTITADINFNGYAVCLAYAETGTTPTSAPTAASVPTGSASSVDQANLVLSNYYFEKSTQGPQCMAAFAAVTPAGYHVVETYSFYLNEMCNNNPKNGVVTISVPGGYSSYKLITVDSTGAVQILDDLDSAAGTASFALHFNGYAVQLIAQ